MHQQDLMLVVFLLEQGRVIEPVAYHCCLAAALITSNDQGLVLHLHGMLLGLSVVGRALFTFFWGLLCVLLLLLLVFDMRLLAVSARNIGLHEVIEVLEVSLVTVKFPLKRRRIKVKKHYSKAKDKHE